MDKKSWLDYLFYKEGKQNFDFLLCGLKKDLNGNIKATKWKKYSEIVFPVDFNESYKLNWVNQRQIFPNEIVIDLEIKEGIKEKLEKLEGIKAFETVKLFSTGSRGYHLHLFCKKAYNSKEKLAVIKFFGGDEQKASDKTMIALEYCPHWKTGKIKEEVDINGRD